MSDAITLVGLPGSGKTAVGRCLAERLDRQFVDVDDLVRAATGKSPTELIEGEGEPAFRRAESEAIAKSCAMPGAVIATGGGAIIDPLNRWALWSAGMVVWLEGADDLLLRRLAASPVRRPLLHGDAAGALARLRLERAPFYRAADARVDTEGSAAGVASAVISVLDEARGRVGASGRRLFDAEVPRHHPLGTATSRVVYGRDLPADAIADVLRPLSSGEPVVVADARAAAALPDLMAALPVERRISIRAGERGKRIRAAERLLETAAAMGAERGDAWLAVGGGTTGDLVGTAAALYLRGVPLVQIPTTWLAQADAAIGGKVAVDLARAKNAVGAFWPPVAVIADVAALRTLTHRQRLDGMAECLKAGLIGDAGLWALVEERGRAALVHDEAARYAILERSVRLKLGVVDRDPFERGERGVLNLGHTLGHALEVESRYRLGHGQAVVLGIRAVAGISAGRGAEPELADRIDAVLAALGYPMRRHFERRGVREALSADKKRVAGRQRWILPMAIGRTEEVDDVSERELDAAIARIWEAA